MLMKIDPRDYKVAVDLGKAAVDEAQADYDNKKVQADRRLALSDLATSVEARQSYTSSAAMALAVLEQQKANLERATVNLARTEIRSPVTGWVTNLLLARVGDYAATGQTVISLVDADRSGSTGILKKPRSSSSTKAIRQRSGCSATGKCCRGTSRASPAASSYQTRHLEKAALPLSTRSSPGCGCRSASRCGCALTLSRPTFGWS
jgi:biotin carboxyl carrier protein